MNLDIAIAGAVLMLSAVALFLRLVPRPGRSESWWVSSEAKALLTAALIVVLVMSGGGMIAKGLFA